EPRADRRGRDAMLTGAGLRDDAPLPEPRGEENLAECVVDLVSTGVVQVLALQNDEPAGRCEALGLVERGRPPHVARAEAVELLTERNVGERRVPATLELVERGYERLRHVAAAVRPVLGLRHPRAAST